MKRTPLSRQILRRIGCLLALVGAALAAATVQASAPPALTATDLDAFFDGFVPYALQRDGIAGGAIVVVKDDQILFAKGYGYSDLVTRKPVDPARTVFRMGSITKLFTWTAAMQLVEQGKLDLDRDVNAYLDFEIPPAFGKPITLRHLMTHTPGFEEVNKDLFVPEVSDLYPLGDYLKRRLPKRILPPGEISAYCNYGTALTGYIVERLSGEPFDDYVARHILEPLQMRHSSMAQPLPANLAAMLSKGYVSTARAEPEPFEVVEGAPAGALSATPADMANFMIAHLQNGRFGESQLLRPETVSLMHSLQYSPAAGVNGFALGFYESHRNGLRMIGHGGDSRVFHNLLRLVPSERIGILVTLNSAGGGGGISGGYEVVRNTIINDFLDRYFPGAPSAAASIPTAVDEAQRVAGWYRSSRRSGFTLAAIQAHVVASPDGTITVSALHDASGALKRWRAVEALTFLEVGGKSRFKFVADGNGRILYGTTDDIGPTMLLQRIEGPAHQGTILPLVATSMVCFIVALVTWGVGFLVRRHYGVALPLSRRDRLLRLGAQLGTASCVVVIVGWPLFVLTAVNTNIWLLVTDAGDPWFYLLYTLSVLALVGIAAMIVNAVQVWRSAERGVWNRVGETLLALAGLSVGWFIITFDLISFRVDF